MPRTRILYGYIENDAARTVSLRKRRLQFFKMLWELAILCGIRACGIVYSPNEEEPVVWPSDLEVAHMLRHYEAIPDRSKYPKKMNQEAYIEDRIKKLEKQLKDVESSNKKMENNHYLHQIYRGGKTFREFTQRDLNNLKGHVEEQQRALRKRMHYSHQVSGSTPDPEPVVEQETLIEDEYPSMEQWFTNMIGDTQYEVDNNNNHQDPSMLGVNHGEIGATSYHTIGMHNGNPQGINGGATRRFPHGNTALYGWSQLDAGGFNVEQGYQGSANIINQGSRLPIGDINGNGSVGHGWLPHQGLYEGQHLGQVGGTSADGALHFPENNNIFGARLPSSNIMDVEQPHYVSSMPYYNHVGGSGGGNVAPQLEDHYNWSNMY